MANVNVEVDGESFVLADLSAIEANLTKKVNRLIAEYTIKVERTVKKKLSTPGTGRVYKRGSAIRGNRATHQASAPGEPPATDTGRLRASIHQALTALASGVMSGEVIAGDEEVEYAADLEFGTDRIAPRPFMRPSLTEHQRDFIRDLKRILNL